MKKSAFFGYYMPKPVKQTISPTTVTNLKELLYSADVLESLPDDERTAEIYTIHKAIRAFEIDSTTPAKLSPQMHIENCINLWGYVLLKIRNAYDIKAKPTLIGRLKESSTLLQSLQNVGRSALKQVLNLNQAMIDLTAAQQEDYKIKLSPIKHDLLLILKNIADINNKLAPDDKQHIAWLEIALRLATPSSIDAADIYLDLAEAKNWDSNLLRNAVSIYKQQEGADSDVRIPKILTRLALSKFESILNACTQNRFSIFEYTNTKLTILEIDSILKEAIPYIANIDLNSSNASAKPGLQYEYGQCRILNVFITAVLYDWTTIEIEELCAHILNCPGLNNNEYSRLAIMLGNFCIFHISYAIAQFMDQARDFDLAKSLDHVSDSIAEHPYAKLAQFICDFKTRDETIIGQNQSINDSDTEPHDDQFTTNSSAKRSNLTFSGYFKQLQSAGVRFACAIDRLLNCVINAYVTAYITGDEQQSLNSQQSLIFLRTNRICRANNAAVELIGSANITAESPEILWSYRVGIVSAHITGIVDYEAAGKDANTWREFISCFYRVIQAAMQEEDDFRTVKVLLNGDLTMTTAAEIVDDAANDSASVDSEYAAPDRPMMDDFKERMRLQF